MDAISKLILYNFRNIHSNILSVYSTVCECNFHTLQTCFYDLSRRFKICILYIGILGPPVHGTSVLKGSRKKVFLEARPLRGGGGGPGTKKKGTFLKL